ncbi:MAG: TylF/MycF/NovP-related O-methyltransferase [Acidobacteriota bacterium]
MNLSPTLRQHMKRWLRPLRTTAGRFVIPVETRESTILHKAAEITSSEHIEGDYIEFGVFRGSTLIQAYHTIRESYLRRSADRTRIHQPEYRDRVRELWDGMRFFGFDSFQGLPPLSGFDVQTRDFAAGKFRCGQEECLRNLRKHGVDLAKVILLAGWFADTCRDETIRRYRMKSAAIVHIDCDLYESTRTVLGFIRPLLVDGTVLVFDDWYSFRGNPALGEQRAFHEWRETVEGFVFVEYQKEGPWRNSFIASRRL